MPAGVAKVLGLSEWYKNGVKKWRTMCAIFILPNLTCGKNEPGCPDAD